MRCYSISSHEDQGCHSSCSELGLDGSYIGADDDGDGTADRKSASRENLGLEYENDDGSGFGLAWNDDVSESGLTWNEDVIENGAPMTASGEEGRNDRRGKEPNLARGSEQLLVHGCGIQNEAELRFWHRDPT